MTIMMIMECYAHWCTGLDQYFSIHRHTEVSKWIFCIVWQTIDLSHHWNLSRNRLRPFNWAYKVIDGFFVGDYVVFTLTLWRVDAYSVHWLKAKTVNILFHSLSVSPSLVMSIYWVNPTKKIFLRNKKRRTIFHLRAYNVINLLCCCYCFFGTAFLAV